jgi:uncharacterized ParB-like nuclease family protein
MTDEITLSVAAIRTDGGTQPRSTILRDVVEEYAAAMADGAKFPAITVFYDGAEYWLADGFHRLAATDTAGREKINCDVRQGTRRDAVLHSVGANAAHGMRRTNDDKRRAVRVMLEDVAPECHGGHVCRDGRHWSQQCWQTWADREIARRCGVGADMVGRLRPVDTVANRQYETRTFVHPKTGQPTQMRTANIGSNPPPRPRPDAPVFDSTPSGTAINWTPQDIPAASPAPRPTRDSSGDYIHHILTEIARQFARLPSVTDAADLYPVDLSHALPVSAVNSIADWFSEFAPLWESGHPDRQEWARKIIEKVKETSVVSTQ